MDRIVLYAGTIQYCFYVSVHFCIHCENLHANALCQTASGNLSQRQIIY